MQGPETRRLAPTQRYLPHLHALGVRNLQHDKKEIRPTHAQAFLFIRGASEAKWLPRMQGLLTLTSTLLPPQTQSPANITPAASPTFFQQIMRRPSDTPRMPAVVSIRKDPPKGLGEEIFAILQEFENHPLTSAFRLAVHNAGWRRRGSEDELRQEQQQQPQRVVPDANSNSTAIDISNAANCTSHKHESEWEWVNNAADVVGLSNAIEKLIRDSACLPSSPQSALTSLVQDEEDMRCVFRSHLDPQFQNPLWDGLESFSTRVDPGYNQATEVIVVVQVVGKESGQCVTVVRQRINLHSLVWVCAEEKNLPPLPLKTVILRMRDGVYVAENVLDLSMRQIIKPAAPIDHQRKMSAVELLDSAVKLREAMRRIEYLRDQCRLHKTLLDYDCSPVMRHLASVRGSKQLHMRSVATDAEVTRLQSCIKHEENELDRRRQALIVRAQALRMLQQALLHRRQNLHILHRALKRDIISQEQVQDSLQQRQWEMVRCLRVVYPIVEDPVMPSVTAGSTLTRPSAADFLTTPLYIRRCALPSVTTFNNMDSFPLELQEQFATATGCVTHLLLLLSKYFQLPLQHPVRYLASRSAIITNRLADSLDFPLYERGMDRVMFNYGMCLLNTNVGQLARALGLEVPESSSSPDLGMLFIMRRLMNVQRPRQRTGTPTVPALRSQASYQQASYQTSFTSNGFSMATPTSTGMLHPITTTNITNLASSVSVLRTSDDTSSSDNSIIKIDEHLSLQDM